MIIYIIRHGETELNTSKRKQGRQDSPLTPNGIKQAECIADILAETQIDAIFTSPLGRAYRTAQIIGAKNGLEPMIIDELVECDFGKWSGLTDAEIVQHYPGEIEKREADKLNYAIPGGESYRDLKLRSRGVMDYILAQGYSYVAVVSHEMIGRTILGNLLDLESREMLRIRQPNEIIYVVDTVLGEVGYINHDRGFFKGSIKK